MSEHDSEEVQPEFFSPTIDFGDLSDLPAEYANIVHVNDEGYVFQVVFGQFLTPMPLPVDVQARLRDEASRNGIPVKPIARLLVHPTHLRAITEVLTRQLEAFEERNGPIPPYPPPSE